LAFHLFQPTVANSYRAILMQHHCSISAISHLKALHIHWRINYLDVEDYSAKKIVAFSVDQSLAFLEDSQSSHNRPDANIFLVTAGPICFEIPLVS